MNEKSMNHELAIHPLCIATMCDHYTRATVGSSKLPQDYPIIGLLFGTIDENQKISINDATDAIYDFTEEGIILNVREIERVKALIVAVYPSYKLVGWYTVASTDATASHLDIHKSMAAVVNEIDPLFVLLNSNPKDLKQLPISIYYSERCPSVDNGSVSSVFIEQQFKLETGPTERLAVDQITKAAATNGLSLAEVQNQAMGVSLETLKGKLSVLRAAMIGMRDGSIPTDCNLIRRIAHVSRRLRRTQALDESFNNEVGDCLMMTYLALATKATSKLNDVATATARTFSHRN